MSYNTQEMSEIRVLSKIDRTALTETLLILNLLKVHLLTSDWAKIVSICFWFGWKHVTILDKETNFRVRSLANPTPKLLPKPEVERSVSRTVAH